MARFKELNPHNYSPALISSIERLNERQRQVVCLDGGMAAVVGNPGSGKTGTMVALVARLVADGHDPARILAMTFTKNAAAEMNQRLKAMGVRGARIGTIHSVSLEIARTECQEAQQCDVDVKNKMTMELKRVLSDFQRKKQISRQGVDREMVGKFISACKSRGCAWVEGNTFGTNAMLTYAMQKEAMEHAQGCGVSPSQLASIYIEMEHRRAAKGLMDFDDMQLWSWLALISSDSARNNWRSRWDTVLMDEQQDSNPLQWDIGRILVGLDSCVLSLTGEKKGEHSRYIEVERAQCVEPLPIEYQKNLYVFGDLAQSIYRFRHAVPELLLEFSQRGDVDIIPLPLNYRSAPGICHAATKLVEGKPWHLAGEIVPAGEVSSLPLDKTYPKVEQYPHPEAEATAAIDWAQELLAGDVDPNEICLMARMHVSLHLAEIECIRKRIPYRKLAGGSFFEDKAIATILAYVRVAAMQDTDGKAIRQIVNKPFRFIGAKYINKCESDARSDNVSLLDKLLQNAAHLSPPQRRGLEKLSELLVEMNSIASRAQQMALDNVEYENAKGPEDMIALMLRKTKYVEDLRREDGLGQEDTRIMMIKELRRIASLFKAPMEFLQYVDNLAAAVRAARKAGLKRGESSVKPALTLSTIHRVKGLEYGHVRILDVVPGRFPHAWNPDQDEELRLFYVGITRAKKECVVSHTASRQQSVDDEDDWAFRRGISHDAGNLYPLTEALNRHRI
jgi:DNA helicase-2/ATP-dependent DNA helicase PcrA